jgi:hypothetical protein
VSALATQVVVHAAPPCTPHQRAELLEDIERMGIAHARLRDEMYAALSCDPLQPVAAPAYVCDGGRACAVDLLALMLTGPSGVGALAELLRIAGRCAHGQANHELQRRANEWLSMRAVEHAFAHQVEMAARLAAEGAIA